jgi:ComF family protein
MLSVRDMIEYVLDTIMPLRERTARTKKRSVEDIPLTPTVHELLGARITTIMDYRESAVQDLMRSLKYDGSAHAANIAAELLAEYLLEEIASLKLFSTRPIIIAPLPLHHSRERERGFNQIEIVLRALPSEFKNGTLAICQSSLARTRATPSQTKLSRKERIKNVANVFQADSAIVSNAHVFLIDDITTTGATLASAGKALRAAGAEVNLIALARA